MKTPSMTSTMISNQRFSVLNGRGCGVCPFGRPPGPERVGCLSFIFCSQCLLPGSLSMELYPLSGPPTRTLPEKLMVKGERAALGNICIISHCCRNCTHNKVQIEKAYPT